MPEFFEQTITTIPATAGLNGPSPGNKIVGHIIVLNDRFTEEYLKPKAWHLKGGTHPAAKFQSGKGGPWKTKALHQLVFARYHGKLEKGLQIDHIDRNPLNNLPSNLRAATRFIQGANRGKNRNNKSGYKGVFWSNYDQKWIAKFNYYGKSVHVGLFDDPISAAKAINKKWKLYFPEVSLPNPELEESSQCRV